MYQIFNSSTTTADWLNIISAVLTIITETIAVVGIFRQVKSKNKDKTSNDSAIFIDNSVSINNTYQNISSYTTTVPPKPQSTAQSLINLSLPTIAVVIIAVAVLWEKIELIKYTLFIICILSFILMLYTARKNIRLGYKEQQAKQLYAYLASYGFCFAAVLSIDTSLKFSITSLKDINTDIQIAIIFIGVLLIIIKVIFNPFKSRDINFRNYIFINNLRKLFLMVFFAFITTLCCSGILSEIAIRFLSFLTSAI